jgi:hypothetical protein
MRAFPDTETVRKGPAERSRREAGALIWHHQLLATSSTDRWSVAWAHCLVRACPSWVLAVRRTVGSDFPMASRLRRQWSAISDYPSVKQVLRASLTHPSPSEEAHHESSLEEKASGHD